MTRDEHWMRRCFQLAQLGAGAASPNPLVGAVLVYEDKIIGEGWHQRWGEAHAEVNCLRSVLPENLPLVSSATLYCNLEPCFHYGKTPPCADLVLSYKIPRVVVSNTDPNPLVAGKSLAKLKDAGVNVTAGVLPTEGRWINRAFFTWIEKKRPYIVLKWAQTADGFMGKALERTPISGPASSRLVHRWRAESDAILVGKQTALTDNPKLDIRHYFGERPLRIVWSTGAELPAEFHLLDDTSPTWIFGTPAEPNPNFVQTEFFATETPIEIPDFLERLYKDQRAILLVEGGSNVLAQFLEAGYWDEIRVIENEQYLHQGIAAPKLPEQAVLVTKFELQKDIVRVFAPNVNPG